MKKRNENILCDFRKKKEEEDMQIQLVRIKVVSDGR